MIKGKKVREWEIDDKREEERENGKLVIKGGRKGESESRVSRLPLQVVAHLTWNRVSVQYKVKRVQ